MSHNTDPVAAYALAAINFERYPRPPGWTKFTLAPGQWCIDGRYVLLDKETTFWVDPQNPPWRER